MANNYLSEEEIRILIGQMSEEPTQKEERLQVYDTIKDEQIEKVNHPEHYKQEGRKECIDEMIDCFGVRDVIIFCFLNAYKYLYRYPKKNGQEDIDKAVWYIQKARELVDLL